MNRIFKVASLMGFLSFYSLLYAQSVTGTFSGIVTEKRTDEALPFATVILKYEDQKISGTMSDLDGKYFIHNMEPGIYTVEVSFFGFTTATIADVTISPGKITRLNVSLDEPYSEPPINYRDRTPFYKKDRHSKIFIREEIHNMGGRY